MEGVGGCWATGRCGAEPAPVGPPQPPRGEGSPPRVAGAAPGWGGGGAGEAPRASQQYYDPPARCSASSARAAGPEPAGRDKSAGKTPA